MATAKNTKKKTTKKSISPKSASKTGSKKAASGRVKKSIASAMNMQMGRVNEDEPNPAHAFGHQKMNLKKNSTLSSSTKTLRENQSAVNNLSRSEMISRKESPQRRIMAANTNNRKGR
jgi:hypothetical protein